MLKVCSARVCWQLSQEEDSVDNAINSMNDAERIIALDETLDQVIKLRGENIEFRAEEENHSNIGAVLGGTAVGAGIGYGGYKNRDKINKYAKAGKGRYNQTRKMGGSVAAAAANAVTPGGAKKVRAIPGKIKTQAEFAKIKANKIKKNPYVQGQARRTGRILKGLRKKIFKYEEPSVEDLMEFMYASDGKGYGDMARKQKKDAKNTTSARTKRKAKANAKLAKKKILAILARRRG